MKSILIEPATNGWIVKAYDPLELRSGVTAADSVAVFNKVEDLQAALPTLLAQPMVVATEPTC